MEYFSKVPCGFRYSDRIILARNSSRHGVSSWWSGYARILIASSFTNDGLRVESKRSKPALPTGEGNLCRPLAALEILFEKGTVPFKCELLPQKVEFSTAQIPRN
jgi:hypothetical protein